MRQEAPSESLSQDENFYVFLSDVNLRKLYNKIINSCQKYHQAKAKSWFLQKLIDEKVIPSFFKVRNKSHNVNSEAATGTSLEWMNVSLKENQVAEKSLLDDLTNHFNNLNDLTPSNLKETLWKKVQS